jgi:hypothetical protein
MTRVGLAAVVALVAAAESFSCASVPSDARIGLDAPNGSEMEFAAVGDFLNHRCGTLDCHGQTGRNLRIWGCEGMRLDPKDIPQCNRAMPGGRLTTAAEHQATYRSLVGLEPTVMSVVVAGHGAHPELLTFVRKSRGTETHKGGTLVVPGDYQDNCITSWLQGHTDSTACGLASSFPSFPMDASTE